MSRRRFDVIIIISHHHHHYHHHHHRRRRVPSSGSTRLRRTLALQASISVLRTNDSQATFTDITMRVCGARIKIYYVLCPKVYSTFSNLLKFPASSRQTARSAGMCDRDSSIRVNKCRAKCRDKRDFLTISWRVRLAEAKTPVIKLTTPHESSVMSWPI